jgi:cell division protein FtsZ
VIWGTVIDPDMQDEVRVTVIATGFDSQEAQMRRAAGIPHHRGREPESAPKLPPASHPHHAHAGPGTPRPTYRFEHEEARRAPAVGLDPSDEDALDIPTFLRRKAD